MLRTTYYIFKHIHFKLLFRDSDAQEVRQYFVMSRLVSTLSVRRTQTLAAERPTAELQARGSLLSLLLPKYVNY